ncbi:hypothetical protein HOLleu_03362 [Holothuria leucospilota]|uniref:C17orf113 probable zinc finger domain-containing protein n=1 Tax=Holothuria leucospilota TaxID=206669 RepID=A0A9Q1CTJ7_HOLLE|nr:hypothetical protein HOLleu_03362 [Holothuria leucospilota]
MAQQRKIQDLFGAVRCASSAKRSRDDSEEEGNEDTDNNVAEVTMTAGAKTGAQTRTKKQKHASQFNQTWQKDRPWLICEIDRQSQKEVMFCKFCQDFNNGEVWNRTGCKRVRLESIKVHEQTNEHCNSMSLKVQVEASHHVREMLTKPKEISRNSMVKAFQCLYWLAKRNIPHSTNFEPLLDLLTQLGLDIKAKICKGANATYTSDTAIKEILMCLSEVIEAEILDDLRKNQYYSLMFDETTDVSTIEQIPGENSH